MKKLLLAFFCTALVLTGLHVYAGGMGGGFGIQLLGGSTPTTGDTTPPAFSSAAVNADAATVTMDGDLDDTAFANLTDGMLTMTGSTTGAVDLESCTELSGVISCTAATSFVNGETVTVSFNGDGDELCDALSNCAADFGPESVTNNTAPAGCAGGTTSGLGAYTNADNQAVNTEDLLVFRLFTVDTGTDGEGNTVDVGFRFLSSENYVNAGVWHIVDANTATLLADGPNTAQGTGGAEDHFTITLDASACMVNGETYAVGAVVSGTDTSFAIYTSGWTGGAVYYTVALSGGDSLSGFDPSTASQIAADKNLGISLTYVAP